jgi:lipoate-protein ligase A
LEHAHRLGPAAIVSWSVLSRPALILGRAATLPSIDWAACRSLGLSVHRRRSGGGAVLWDRHLIALDVVLPAGHELLSADVVASYRWLGEALAEGLVACGVRAHVVDVQEARRDEPGPARRAACFGALSPWEVTAGGRKVVGLSQARRRGGAILQAGLPLRFDTLTLARVLGGDGRMAAALESRTAGIADLVPEVTRERVESEITRSLAARLGRRREGLPDPEIRRVEERLAAASYGPLNGLVQG